jgi:hypothetical protein
VREVLLLLRSLYIARRAENCGGLDALLSAGWQYALDAVHAGELYEGRAECPGVVAARVLL